MRKKWNCQVFFFYWIIRTSLDKERLGSRQQKCSIQTQNECGKEWWPQTKTEKLIGNCPYTHTQACFVFHSFISRSIIMIMWWPKTKSKYQKDWTLPKDINHQCFILATNMLGDQCLIIILTNMINWLPSSFSSLYRIRLDWIEWTKIVNTKISNSLLLLYPGQDGKNHNS